MENGKVPQVAVRMLHGAEKLVEQAAVQAIAGLMAHFRLLESDIVGGLVAVLVNNALLFDVKRQSLLAAVGAAYDSRRDEIARLKARRGKA